MELILKEIMSATDGWNAFLKVGYLTLLIVAFVVYKLALSQKGIREDIAEWVKNRVYRVNSHSLKSSPLFLNKNRFFNDVSSIIFIQNPLKTAVFQEFFRVKVEIDHGVIDNFNKINFKSVSADELFVEMTNAILDMESLFEPEIKSRLSLMCFKELSAIVLPEGVSSDAMQSSAERCSNDMYRYLMTASGGYQESRKTRIDLLLDEIELIKVSVYYQNNYEKVYHFYDMLYLSIKRAILRASVQFAGFNGEIDNIYNNHLKELLHDAQN